MSLIGPSVWTSRALQAESDDLEKLVLRICIRPIHGAFELLAIMDIRACSISFASRPRRPYGPPVRVMAGPLTLRPDITILILALVVIAKGVTQTRGRHWRAKTKGRQVWRASDCHRREASRPSNGSTSVTDQ
jgi:hypothetical protein